MLYADLATVKEISEYFPTAQHVRRLLQSHGFSPLTKLGNAEYWTRGTKLVIFGWEGDVPSESKPRHLQGATLVCLTDGKNSSVFSLSLD
jgi:hypothetical protein